jgi:hypothetical protein
MDILMNNQPISNSYESFEPTPMEKPLAEKQLVKDTSCCQCGGYKDNVALTSLSAAFSRLIKHSTVNATAHHHICSECRLLFLTKLVGSILKADRKETAQLQEEVMKNLAHYETQERNWQDQFNKIPTFGEKCADNVAKFGGSWRFLLYLGSALLTWIILNIILSRFNVSETNPNGSKCVVNYRFLNCLL